MKRSISFSIVTLISFLVCSNRTFGQPRCLPVDTLEHLVSVGEYELVVGRLGSVETIEDFPQILRITVDIEESLRGTSTDQRTFVYDASSMSNVESQWPDQLLDSQQQVLLVLSSAEWSYPHGYLGNTFRNYTDQAKPDWFYRAHVSLNEQGSIWLADMSRLTDPQQIVETAKQLVSEMESLPEVRSIALILPHEDRLMVPLSPRLRQIAGRWRESSENRFRDYAEQILWEFTLEDNRPFDGGYWSASIEGPAGKVRFGLRLKANSTGVPQAIIQNGEQPFIVESVLWDDDELTLEFPRTTTTIVAALDREHMVLEGVFRKPLDNQKWQELPFQAIYQEEIPRRDIEQTDYGFLRSWQIQRSTLAEPSAAKLFTSNFLQNRHANPEQPIFGDWKTEYSPHSSWGGASLDGRLELYQFDGAHALLLRAERVGDASLRGTLWFDTGQTMDWTAELSPRR